jgi:hypothetical protein
MWTYHGREVTDEMVEGYQAFVYIIVRTDQPKFYIGKKRLIKKSSKPPLKGKKRKRVSYGASDWRDYYGSSDELLKDIETHGKENFRREILYLAKSLGDSSYVELFYQIQTWAITDPRFYNLWLSCRTRASHIAKIDHVGVDFGMKRIETIQEEFQ